MQAYSRDTSATIKDVCLAKKFKFHEKAKEEEHFLLQNFNAVSYMQGLCLLSALHVMSMW